MELFFLALLMMLMAGALASGYPVAFALPGSAIITIILAGVAGYLFAGDTDAYFAIDGPSQWLSAGVTNFRFYWEPERDTLIAIPLFIFMGIMLQRSKIAEDLLVTMAQLFGPIPGGLGISVVFVGALLAATTGIVGATVVAMGLISLPAMLRNNYSRPLASGAIAASGTLGQIIPPSIVLIILADQLASAVDQASTARKTEYREATGEISMPPDFDVTSTSAGDMFLGAFLPGLVLVGLYMTYILIFALIRPSSAPTVRFEGQYDAKFIGKVLLTLVPPLALIFLVLGSIIAGVATVNQAGAIGAAGALVMAGYRLCEGQRGAYIPAVIAIASVVSLFFVLSNFDTNIRTADTAEDQLGVTLAAISVIALGIAIGWSGLRALRIDDTLRGVMIETAKTTSLVFIILIGAAMLTAAFRAFGGEDIVKEFLGSLPGGFWTQFFIVMLVIFILGFFLDFIEIAVVVVPIVAPILLANPEANVTAVWLGVMIGLNIQTSFLTPPFGFALFYLRGVAPAVVKTLEIYRGVIPFISLQLLALVIVAFTPALVNFLPQRVSLTAETAPPPNNPRLQYCLENYVTEAFERDGESIRQAIAAARGLDLSGLPEDLADDLRESFDKAEEAFPRLAAIGAAEEAVALKADAYRPVHQEVRAAQRLIRRETKEIEELETAARRALTDAERARFQARADALKEDVAALEASIPENWDEFSATFQELTKAENQARRQYRRTVDDAAEPLIETIEILDSVPALEALGPTLSALDAEIDNADAEAAVERFKEVRAAFSAAPEVGEIRSLLNKARRELDRNTPNRGEARALLTEAAALYESELAWRRAAEASLRPDLERYREAIGDTIAVRALERLPNKHAVYIAGCQSEHRDISLFF
ncbi:MAG: TRAP transporter large permease subunit [Pseudomonadota bacterium]